MGGGQGLDGGGQCCDGGSPQSPPIGKTLASISLTLLFL